MGKIERVILILALAGIVGIVMIVFSPDIPHARASIIVEHLGIALLVACIVGFTVELYVRRQMRLQMNRMLQDVGTDVFKAALGHEFPESIWDQVSTHLLLNPIIRENMSIEYNLENLQECNGDFVRARTCWSYTIHNLNSTRDWLYPFSVALDRCLDSRFRDQTKFNRVEVDGHHLQDEHLSIDVREAEVTCKTTITLRPDESKEIGIYGESVYRSDQVIPFSMTDPTENITVTISKPPNIAVTVDPLHPREERLKELPTASPESRRCWIITGGLLPGHGVCIRWFPC